MNSEFLIMSYELYSILAKLCKFTKSLRNYKALGWLFPYCFIFSAWISTNSPIYNFFQAGCPVVLTICNILIVNSLTRTTQAVPRLSLSFPFIPLVLSCFSINRYPDYTAPICGTSLCFPHCDRIHPLLMATIRANGRHHSRGWSRPSTCMLAINYRKVFIKTLKAN